MEKLEQYGDLEGDELYKFLEKLESDDDDISEEEEKAEMSIEYEEATVPDEMLEDGAWVAIKRWDHTEDGRYYISGFDIKLKSEVEEDTARRRKEAREKAAAEFEKRMDEHKARRKQRKIEINRAAFSQEKIKLSDTMPKEHLTLLITALTSEHRRMADKFKTYINKRLEALLLPLMPRILRTCADRYPHSVLKCQGFMYVASKAYGDGKTFWATPSIPYYFRQNTEQETLSKHKHHFLYKLDRAVLQYNYHIESIATKEIKYASSLVRNSIKTYFDLMKYNPFWFEKLYNYINEDKLCSTNY